MSTPAQRAAAEISVYLTTGMNEATPEGQAAIVAIIERQFPVKTTADAMARALERHSRSMIRVAKFSGHKPGRAYIRNLRLIAAYRAAKSEGKI